MSHYVNAQNVFSIFTDTLSKDDFTHTSGSVRFLNSDGFVVTVTLDKITFTPDLLAN